jgi:hypothetical protein
MGPREIASEFGTHAATMQLTRRAIGVSYFQLLLPALDDLAEREELGSNLLQIEITVATVLAIRLADLRP